MMAIVMIMGLSVVMWALLGYSLAFGGNHGGIIGDFRWFGLEGVGWDIGPYSDSIPNLVFCAFQMMFAIITPALITGSVVGRMKFKGTLYICSHLVSNCILSISTYGMGSGRTFSRVRFCRLRRRRRCTYKFRNNSFGTRYYSWKRKGYERATYRIHNIPFVVLGATILWFGWFGFNAGSALKADGLAAHAFMTSAIASASALLSWMFLDVINDKKTTLVGASTGLVIGFVAITPGAGFVPIWSSFIIGALVSPICYYGVILIKKKLK